MLKMRNFQGQETNNCINLEAENGRNPRRNLQHFESQETNNCTKNDAESEKTTETNIEHFEAKIQITAKRKKLKLQKK